MKFDLKESREGFCRRGRGRSFHVEGPKTERAREPRVESLGATNLETGRIRGRAESTGRVMGWTIGRHVRRSMCSGCKTC